MAAAYVWARRRRKERSREDRRGGTGLRASLQDYRGAGRLHSGMRERPRQHQSPSGTPSKYTTTKSSRIGQGGGHPVQRSCFKVRLTRQFVHSESPVPQHTTQGFIHAAPCTSDVCIKKTDNEDFIAVALEIPSRQAISRRRDSSPQLCCCHGGSSRILHGAAGATSYKCPGGRFQQKQGSEQIFFLYAVTECDDGTFCL